MQKLKAPRVSLGLKSKTGSALVGAVALSIVLFITGFGYLQLFSTGYNNEIESLRDDKAFLAAESGLYLGVLWLWLNQGSWPTGEGTVAAVFSSLSVNGINVIVKDSVGNGGEVFIISQAGSPKLPYIKKISWGMTRSLFPGNSKSIYMNDGAIFNGNTFGLRKLEWDGPFHSNTAIQFGNPGMGNECYFDGSVTVHNIDPSTGNPVYDSANGIGHFGNDYRYGLKSDFNRNASDWDNIFKSTYDGDSPIIMAQLNQDNKTDINLNTDGGNLIFGVASGTPYYEYNGTRVNYDPAVEWKLHIVGKGVSVSGTLKGKVTVYTDPGKPIYLPGDLTYEDFSTASFGSTDTASNRGYGKTSTNVLGLYSGANFVVTNVDHNITGQLFAVNDANTSVEFQDKNSILNLFGSLSVSRFWDPKQGNDQPVFNQSWDRRPLSAPGLGYIIVNDNGDPYYAFIFSNWSEKNTPVN